MNATTPVCRVDVDATTAIPCPHCDEDLEVHQPDVDLPDRLLAVCRCCKAWFLAEPGGDLACLVPAAVRW